MAEGSAFRLPAGFSVPFLRPGVRGKEEKAKAKRGNGVGVRAREMGGTQLCVLLEFELKSNSSWEGLLLDFF